jgi:serine protease inhibitor
MVCRRMSMFLILPDQVDPGIRDLEQNITTSLIKELMATLQVRVKLPDTQLRQVGL